MREAMKRLRCLAIVVLEQSAESLLAADFGQGYGRAVGWLGFGFLLGLRLRQRHPTPTKRLVTVFRPRTKEITR